MSNSLDRRTFVKAAAASAVLGSTWGAAAAAEPQQAGTKKDSEKKPLFEISLAEWSLHRTLFGRRADGKKLDHLDFARTAKEDFGIDAVEYVNQFFKDKAQDQKYLAELKKRADDAGVRGLLIMIDGEGDLGHRVEKQRLQAVENHYKWVEAAKFLGCHSIRVNARSDASLSYEEQRRLAADGLRKLADFAALQELNVIVENHGGLSSNGRWLAETIEAVGLKNCGTLPDFGNFNLGGGKQYDRYQGVKELMPFAKGVSAKSHEFDADGNETATDYLRMLKIVIDAGYRGYVGIEYEGKNPREEEGILATKKLLLRVREKLASS